MQATAHKILFVDQFAETFGQLLTELLIASFRVTRCKQVLF